MEEAQHVDTASENTETLGAGVEVEEEVRGGPRSRHVKMTPARAQHLFENCNDKNRPFVQSAAEALKVEIQRGNWRANGEAIKISKTGKVLDGQHRLWAIWQSGVTMPVLLVTDLDDEVFSTLDQGRKRSGGDVLAIRGVKRHSQVAGACQMIYRLLKDKPIGQGVSIPAYGIERIWERHPTIADVVEIMVPIYNSGDGEPPISLPYLAAYRYLLDPIMAKTDEAADLVKKMITGANMDADDPILRFRARIQDTRKRSATIAGSVKLALLTRTVGMHVTGERVGRAFNAPDTTDVFSAHIPGMKEALAALTPEDRLDDLDY